MPRDVRLLAGSLLLLFTSCALAGKTKGNAAYQPAAGDILFQSLPNPPGMDLVDAIEDPGNLPLTPRDLAEAKELTRVPPAE